MAADLTSSEVEEIEHNLSQPTKWLGKELEKQARAAAPASVQPDAEITLYAHVEAANKSSSVVKVAKWSASDLYAYSETPRIELLNVFGQLLDACQNISSAYDTEDFELKTIELWSKFFVLNNFLGISPKHDEVIAILQMLPSAGGGILNEQKLTAVKSALTLLHEAINVTDELLDKIEDELESAEFDLEVPMNFSEMQ